MRANKPILKRKKIRIPLPQKSNKVHISKNVYSRKKKHKREHDTIVDNN